MRLLDGFRVYSSYLIHYTITNVKGAFNYANFAFDVAAEVESVRLLFFERPHTPTKVVGNGKTHNFTYDANGNMLTGLNGKVMTYDAENRPVSVTYAGEMPLDL